MKQYLKKIVTKILWYEARLVLKKHKPKIIAITGNVGKTSLKEGLFSILKDSHFVRKNDKSFNSRIGIPLAVLGIPTGWDDVFSWTKNILAGLKVLWFEKHYPEILILEIGAEMPGDIEFVAKHLTLHTLIFTMIGEVPSHVEFFDSPEHILEEKAALIKSLKVDGNLILNADDKNLETLRGFSKTKIFTYGIQNEADLSSSNYQILYDEESFPQGITFKVNYEGSSIPITINDILGQQQIYSILAAILGALKNDQGIMVIHDSLINYLPPAGRMRILRGVKDSIIIDDTYNSSPLALEEGLKTLKEVKSLGRKIAVLGDMLELGKYMADEHIKAGKNAAGICDMLVAVGIRARYFTEGALQGGMSEKNIFQFDTSKEAGKFVEGKLKKGDCVFVKGSQNIRMEKAVEEIMLEPLKKEELLVRQNEEWK